LGRDSRAEPHPRGEPGRRREVGLPYQKNGGAMEHEPDRDEAARPAAESDNPPRADVEGTAEAAGYPAAPPPAEVGAARPGTGEPRVDAALRLLDRLPGLPVSDHPELFERVHAQLSDVLGELDSGSAGPADAPGS
jgi:hypothetical protein